MSQHRHSNQCGGGLLTSRPSLGGLGLSTQPNLLSSHCDCGRIGGQGNKKTEKVRDSSQAPANDVILSPMTFTLIAGVVVPFRGKMSQPPDDRHRLDPSGDFGIVQRLMPMGYNTSNYVYIMDL